MGIKKVSPTNKTIILVKKYPRRSIGRKIETFCRSRNEVTQDLKIFDTVKGFKIPFHSKIFQSKFSSQPIVSQEGEEFVKLEVKEMLKKGTIRKFQPSKGEFVRNLFLVKKKD